MSEGKSLVDKAVQLTSSKKRGSLYHQEAIEEPIISFQKAGDRPPMVSGVSNSSYSFDSPISHRVSYAANERSVRKARTTSSILSPFKKKTCIYYFENEEKLGFCKCGRPKSDHSKDAIKNANFQWNIKKHIKSCKTNAYGEVEFHGTNRKTRAKYIRVSDETDAKDALKLLLREWKLEYPNFLVSVTGGAKTFKLPVKLKHLFSNGLYKVAQTSGAWVITGGTNTGVMKHVGEALQIASNTQYGTQGDSNRRVYCIGIATWGIVENRNLLTNTRGTVKYYMKNSIEAAGACLDNNHTHFFLVDNGTVNQYGKEIQFRARLEKQIMKMEVDKNRGKVPAVLLVLEGGPNTVATVYEAITNDPAVPVIVIKDSGRAADLLAYAHNISHGEGTFYYMGDVVEHKQLFKRIEQTYPELNQEGCLKVYGNVLKCVERKHLITIFEMEEGTADLDQAILKALLKSKSASPEEQLKLALLWNRPDVARAQIFSEELKWPLSSLESAMKVALAKDRTEFVELLLEQGVSMGNFLTRDRLDSLYSTRARERKSMLRYMLDKAKFGAVTLRDAESLFYTLTGLSLNPQQQQSHRTVPHAIAHIVPLNTRDALHQSFHHPFNQLFVWAVLNNMQKMALCFWKHGEEPMAKALVACKLYFALAKYADKRDMKDDIMETLTTNGEEFQRLAVQLLDHCFVTDESRSSKLMTYELRNWGNTTNLNLAVTSGHTLFVAHSCNQELLTDIWSGVMTLRTLKSLKTVLCMFCPPLVLCLSFRTKREVLKMPQTEGMLDEFSFREEDEEDAPVTNVEIEEGLEEKKGDLNLKRNETFSSSFDDSILGASERDADTVMSAEMVKTQSLSYLEKYRGFYTAPITKFWGNVLAYLVFLGLFTYVLLGKLEKNLSNTEIVVIVFVISMTTEEIRQVLKSDTGRLYKKVYEWSRSKWNLCDGLAIFLFYIGLALRLNPSTVSAGRVVLAVDIMFWIIRLLDIFSVNQNLGPYVVIIGKMTIDLAYFLFIMAVFLLAYGVARQTILEPNKPVSWKSVAEIFFVPYFQVYGELFIDKEHLYSNNLTYFGTTKHNDYSEPAVSLLMAFYLLIANILLLNLLIAIFNNTFSKVQVNSNQIWKFQRYHLILEYARRPPLVPPFVFLNHMFSVLSWAYNQCRRSDCCGGHQNESSFKTDRKIKIYPSSAELDDLMQFEGNCLADFLHKRKNAFLSSKEEKGRLVLEKIDNISWRLEEFKRETWTREERIDTKMLKVQHKLEEFSKSLSKALTVLTDKQSGMGDKVRSNSIPASGMQHVPMKSSAPAATVNGLGRTPPTMRRFLSQNPYMHHPAYDQTSSVKEAAWNFRKSSLTSPLRAKLIQAYYNNDVDNVGEDCVDGAPPQPQLQVDEEGTPKEEAVQETDKIFAEDMIDQELAPDGFDSVDGNDAICTGSQSQPHPLSHIQSLSHSQPQLHTKARKSPYPASGVARFPVPDCFVHWEVDFPEYNPPDYTSVMLKLSTSIDKDDTSDINFNTLDNGVDRKSFFGLYEVIDGRPRNPFGRTGLTGRGLLGRWGPNHATEAIVTRWKRGLKGEIFTRGKSSLEFLGLKKNDVVIFPGEINKASAKVPEIVLKALATRKKQNVDQQPWEKFSDTTEISIYFDDTRNTDNAWLETKVINYHFDFEMDTDFKLENSNLFWIELDSEVSVTAEHNECLAKVAEKRGAHF